MGFLFLSAIKDEVWRQQVGQSLRNSPPSNWQMKLSFQIKSAGEKRDCGHAAEGLLACATAVEAELQSTVQKSSTGINPEPEVDSAV